jgi:hypothetical protein
MTHSRRHRDEAEMLALGDVPHQGTLRPDLLAGVVAAARVAREIARTSSRLISSRLVGLANANTPEQ